jgi:hypothetical protein
MESMWSLVLHGDFGRMALMISAMVPSPVSMGRFVRIALIALIVSAVAASGVRAAGTHRPTVRTLSRFAPYSGKYPGPVGRDYSKRERDLGKRLRLWVPEILIGQFRKF